MFDARLRPLIDPPLNAAGRRLAARGVSPDAVTLTGFGLGLGAALAIALGAFLARDSSCEWLSVSSASVVELDAQYAPAV